MMKVFLNISNHPSSGWSESQKKSAQELASDNLEVEGYRNPSAIQIVDVSFPDITLESTDDVLMEIISPILQKIYWNEWEVGGALVQGEFVAVFDFVHILSRFFSCYSALSKRIVEEKDGKRTYTFQFLGYREYNSKRNSIGISLNAIEKIPDCVIERLAKQGINAVRIG